MKKIHLFWWNEKKIMNKSHENYGDLLGFYLVSKMTDKKVVFAWPKKRTIFNFFKPIYLTIGSILHNADKKSIVWGSGLIDRSLIIQPAKFLAVRGPITRELLIKQGHTVPEVYGDPALLLPKYYNPVGVKKKFKLGIIPHYTDFNKTVECIKNNELVKIINLMSDSIEKTTNEILECEFVISSSLHGVIVSHAYGIPALWTKFSDNPFGDDMKYDDYFLSVGIQPYKINYSLDQFDKNEVLKLFNDQKQYSIDSEKLHSLQQSLLNTCPFI